MLLLSEALWVVWALVLIAHIALAPSAVCQAPGVARAAESDTLRIVLVADGPGALMDRFAAVAASEIEATLGGRRPVSVATRVGTWDADETARRLAEAQQSEAEAVVALGPFAAAHAAGLATAARPLVVADVSTFAPAASKAPAAVQVVRADLALGAAFDGLVRLREAQHGSAPRRVAVVLDAAALGADPTAAERIQGVADRRRISIELAAAGTDLEQVALQLSDEVEAVLIAPLLTSSADAQAALATLLHERGLISLALGGEAVLARGFLASLDVDPVARTARRAALALLDLLRGADRSDADASLVVTSAARALDEAPTPTLLLSAERLDALDIALPWSLRFESRIVGASLGTSTDQAAAHETPPLALAEAMRASIRRNLDLRIDQLDTEAASKNVGLARSALLPQIGSELYGRIIGEGQAEAALAGNPERQLTGSVFVRQVLFSEPAFARVAIEARRQAAREYELDVTRLAAAERAAAAHLGVQRAAASLRIQEEDLAVARQNLDAGRARLRVGAAGPAEVARLETALARAQQRVAEATGRLRTAEIALNRVLDRPLDLPVALPAGSDAAPDSLLARFPYAAPLDRPRDRDRFTAFWVGEAQAEAPEIDAVEELVAAQERRLASSSRAFYLPDLSLGASYTRIIEEGGTGAGAPDAMGLPIQAPPDDQWLVGVTLSFPLFEGGRRVYARQQDALALRATEAQRTRTEQLVEERTRGALVGLEAAYIAALQALRAVATSERALAAVQASYAEGTAAVLDLLDAQRDARVAEEQAADAVFDLYRDAYALERAAGGFAVLRTPEAQARFEARLQDALAAP